MRTQIVVRAGCSLILAVSLVGALGCGTEPDRKPPPAPADPLNDTPSGAIVRLEWAYENREVQAYQDLFTGDFTYEFRAAEPGWGAPWLKLDEDSSAAHLFRGGSRLAGEYINPASKILLVLETTTSGPDLDAPDSVHYRMLLTRVDGEFHQLLAPGDTLKYLFINHLHRFHLVRGDLAASLGGHQPADSTHWYVWKWKDESVDPLVPSGAEDAGSLPPTWGRIKALWR